jgi:hypothetical protein
MVLEEFQQRVTGYAKLRDQARSSVGRLTPTGSPDRIAEHEKDWADKIREARASAVQGNIFTPRTGAIFRRLIASSIQGRNAARVHQSLRRSEPVVVPLKVNAPYPDGVALQTTPPTLLQNLPQLPHELEYRVVGRALVIRDVGANLIVDFLPKALP